MSRVTRIPGKDAPLETSISRAHKLLDTYLFPVDFVSSLHPVKNCWSVHLCSRECPHIFTNGKGGSRLASEGSALFEFFERLSTNLFFADYYLGPASEMGHFLFYPNEIWFPFSAPSVLPTHHPDGTPLLNETLRKFYDPDGDLTPLMLLDNNSDIPGRGIAALPFQPMSTAGDAVYFPVNILNNLYASNGMAAGNTPTECRAQALSEIIERYVKNKIIAEGICLPTVPTSVLDRHPAIQEDLKELRDKGFPVIVKDASLGGQFPVICALLLHPESGGCYAAFGASCRFGVALERTVTELLQGRALDQLDHFERPSHQLDEVADPLNLESHFVDSVGLLSWKMFGSRPSFVFNDWGFKGTTAEECERLLQIIGALDNEAYCAEYEHCGVYTCRIIVPGMSEVYPCDDLVWNNKNAGSSIRPQLLKLNRMSKAELRAFSITLDELGLSEQLSVSDAIGVLFEEGTTWYSLRLGELKAMVALAAGDHETAALWSSWCVNSGLLPSERLKHYRLVNDLLELELGGAVRENYQAALTLFFGEQAFVEALAVVDGTVTFYGLTFANDWTQISSPHRNLLDIYQRLHLMKRAQSL